MFQKRTPIVLILNNIRSLHNVGAIFRSADGVNIEKIYLCGLTGRPPNKKISKTALGAENSVPSTYRCSALRLIKTLKRRGYQIVVLEKTADAILYSNFKPNFSIALVVGNEVEGVDERIRTLADFTIEIPMLGRKESLNVATACGIALYKIAERFF